MHLRLLDVRCDISVQMAPTFLLQETASTCPREMLQPALLCGMCDASQRAGQGQNMHSCMPARPDTCAVIICVLVLLHSAKTTAMQSVQYMLADSVITVPVMLRANRRRANSR